ncbi:MAG TPA: oxidoreductase [Cyanobacteria bacterium UBA8156]|jgi:NADP-dependent 3-hydroxy acid dehydrogenase YdfG|nr:oxidoreductase [Cyanobacteria bacterium UBA8156]
MSERVVLVVGASGGIGSATARVLAEQGYRLMLAGRDRERLAALAAVVDGAIAVGDITDPGQAQGIVAATVAQYGRLDVLVNAAGAGVMKQVNKIEPADLDRMLAVNLKGNFFVSQAAAEAMKEQKSGHLCQVIGILGKHTMPMAAAYSAAKFGAVGAAKCLAEEVRRYGIRSTLFYFGGVDTPFWDNVALKVDRSKMLRPETAAAAIAFAIGAEPQAVPLEIDIQPDSHVFF